MLTLSKQFAVTIQNPKPFRNLKLSNSSEHAYLISRRQRISEVSSTGKLRKILISRKESKILASGVSECSTLIAGLISTGQIVVCSKKKKVFQSFLLPPQIKLSIDMMKPEHCSLYIFDKGLVLIAPNDQVWLWKADDDLKDPKNISPHIKGSWLNLNSSNFLRGCSEVNTWRSNISDSRPSSNSSRPANFKSRFTTHAFSIRVSSDCIRGMNIGVLRLWLRSINEDSCILESRFLTVNIINRAQAKSLTSWISSAEEFVYKGSLEFWSKKGHKDMGLVARLDHTNSIVAIGVNSSHPYFCQLVFLSPTTGACTTRKLCNYATVDDIPNTSNDGQTSFWIDDIAWSPDDTLIIVAFKSGFISIFNRIGEPLNFVLNMIQMNSEAKIFSHAFFTTDPEIVKKYGSFMSIDWSAGQIVLSDGFSICELGVSQMPTIKDLIPLYIPVEVEQPDISINISHETNPIPSEIDSGPKRKNIEKAFQLLRSCLSNCHAVPSKELIFQITSWIDNVLPPQLHEEINYTALPNSRFETEARLSNNLILKKKMHAIDVYGQFNQIISMESWSLVHNSESREWIMSIAYQVFKYMIADQQALYSWNVLKLFERWAGFRLQRIRNMLIIYSLIQYRNHQANHINVIYFLIAYAAARGNSQNFLPIISQHDEEFIRTFIKLNLDLSSQIDPKAILSLNSFYYLNNRVKEKIDGPLNYLLGYSNNFSDIYQEICCQLLKGNIKYIDSYLNNDSLLLFAYYFDPTENFFISPIEAASAFACNASSIYEILENMKKLSQIQVVKDKKYQKDAAFIYWILRVYERIEYLLPVDTAFYAISRLIPALDQDDALKAVMILKRLFLKDSHLKLIELSHQDLRQLFQKYALEIVRDKLKVFIQTDRFRNIVRNGVCAEVYNKYCSEELGEYIQIFKSVVGDVSVLKDKTEKWLDMEKSNFSDCEYMVARTIQDILRYLWYIHIEECIDTSDKIDFRIRLLSICDLCDKSSIIDKILQENLSFSPDSKNIIALYLRNTLFPQSHKEKYLKWLDRIKSSNESAHILHSLEQPAYVNPWIFDTDFLNFSDSILKISTTPNNTSEVVIKSWNSIVKNLSKQYKTTGFLRYQNSLYVECKELEDLDSTLYQSLFSETITISFVEDKKNESMYISPIIPHKKRVPLEFPRNVLGGAESFSTCSLISCKKILNALKSPLRRVLTLLRPTRKSIVSPTPKLKRINKESSCFFISKKPSQDIEENSKIIGLKFVNILETQQRPSKHRRIQSVMLPSVTSQKPFQIIRVQKSYAIEEEDYDA